MREGERCAGQCLNRDHLSSPPKIFVKSQSINILPRVTQTDSLRQLQELASTAS